MRHRGPAPGRCIEHEEQRHAAPEMAARGPKPVACEEHTPQDTTVGSPLPVDFAKPRPRAKLLQDAGFDEFLLRPAFAHISGAANRLREGLSEALSQRR